MKDRYTKDVENQNYDLMKRLAEVEEILEDYNKRLKHNSNLSQTLIIKLINELWHKTNHLHKFKVLLEENDIPHDYDFINDLNSEAAQVANSYLNEMLGCWEGKIDELFPSDALDAFIRHVKPYFITDSEEEDEDVDF